MSRKPPFTLTLSDEARESLETLRIRFGLRSAAEVVRVLIANAITPSEEPYVKFAKQTLAHMEREGMVLPRETVQAKAIREIKAEEPASGVQFGPQRATLASRLKQPKGGK